MSNTKIKNAISYYRVSSKKQSENYSLQTQEDGCRKYALENGYKIIRHFKNKDGESAKNINRKAFQAMLQYMVENRKEIDALIVYALDRISRNMADYTAFLQTLERLGIELISVTERFDSSPTGEFMKHLKGAIAALDNAIRKQRAIEGMRKAVRAGRWVWKPQTGYELIKDPMGKPVLKPNKDAPHIRNAFKLAEKGIYTQVEILGKLRRDGFETTRQNLNRILRNNIYAGLIKIEGWLDEPIKGIHESIISEMTFYKVQQLLDGKRPTLKPHLRNNPEFPLRRFIRCSSCGGKITGSYSTGRHGEKYAYYKCRSTGCNFGNIKRDSLHRQFINVMEKIKPTSELTQLFDEIVRDVWLDKNGENIKVQKQIENKINKGNDRRKKVRRLFIDGALSQEDYDEEMNDIRENIEGLKIDLSEIRVENIDIDGCLDYCNQFFSNFPNLWENADINLKQRFQSFIFPQGINYFQGKFETPITSLVFNVLQEKTTIKSHLASPRGFEPLLPP